MVAVFIVMPFYKKSVPLIDTLFLSVTVIGLAATVIKILVALFCDSPQVFQILYLKAFAEPLW